MRGLRARVRTVAETIEIARDIAKRLIEVQGEDATQPDSRSNIMIAIIIS
jgi:hypothetical protein